MSRLIHFAAYVDFTYSGSLEELAEVLSQSLFAGLRFVGLGEGIWDEVPAVRLERNFLGLRVELGGAPGRDQGFTLQVEPIDFPWNRIPAVEASVASVDLSAYLGYLLEQVEGVSLKPIPAD